MAISALWFRNLDNRSDFNGNNRNLNDDNRARGIVQLSGLIYFNMEYSNFYPKIYNFSNLLLAWRKARKGKTKKLYVREFEKER